MTIYKHGKTQGTILLDRELPEFDDDDWESDFEILADAFEDEAEEDEDDWEPESWDYIMYGSMDGIAREY